MTSAAHIPVLFDEVVQALETSPDDLVVDATYGRGGHANRVLSLLQGTGKLIVIDRDPDAIAHAQVCLADCENVEVVHASFANLKEILEAKNVYGKVDAILFDFGVSSPQLDMSERGFSFQKDGPLDMRMDTTQPVTAQTLIHDLEEQDLVRILKDYGEERFARRIARKIKEQLTDGTIETTGQLARLVSAAVPKTEKGKHPATRTFQAIRIAVNRELMEIEAVLPQALDALALGGRLVVISFHSLEDRIVKRFFRLQSKGDPYPVDLPVTADMLRPRLELVGKPMRASDQEIDTNIRSRSAILRVARKVA